MVIKGKKRKAQDAAISNSKEQVDLPDGWLEKLVALGPALAHVIGELANRGQISASEIKRARTSLPSFSVATKWGDLAPGFGLSAEPLISEFEAFSSPLVHLPPSFHEDILGEAWRIQDVYQERVSQEREEARVRIFDAYMVPIVALFQGRIIDKPEHNMPSSAYSSGGEVEHELFMIGGILFFVIELKLLHGGKDNIAQVFLELLSVAEMNRTARFEGLRVYALLTDLTTFKFYSYDPIKKKFAFDETIIVNVSREILFADMIHVANKVFSVILFAYIEGLTAIAQASRRRQPQSPTGSSPAERRQRNRMHQNALALDLAQQCLQRFQLPVRSIEDIETQSSEAIGLLTKSVRAIPRFSDYTAREDPSNPVELKKLARRIVQTEHERLFRN